MIKFILKDKEVGVEDNFIGDVHYEVELNSEATAIDVVDGLVRLMRIAEYHDDSIVRALRDVCEELDKK